MYVLLFAFGDMCIRAWFTAVSGNMCNYSGMYVCIYIYTCMVITYQPGKVANPARGQLAEQGK